MIRITVDEVRHAYAVTGCRPVVSQLHGLPGQHDGSRHDERACCGIGAILFAKGCDPQKEDFDAEAQAMFDREYLEGFYAGFDGDNPETEVFIEDRRFEGYQDGSSAHLAIFGPDPESAQKPQ